MNRRDFLKRSAALTAPLFVPASALGLGASVAASDRITVGVIGTGGQGRGLANAFMGEKDVQLVAVCDVDANHLKQAKAQVDKKYGNADCAAFKDFRELLAKKEIDAVVVATPDHWHALASVAAAKAGKDIYCEKPLANSIGEGRAIANAVKENKRILQCGSHERSGANSRFACELVRSGRIGNVHTVRINLPCTDGHHLAIMKVKDVPPPEKVPENLDWDFWLGHTPMVPYHPSRCHFNWRWILAHGGGEMTDRGAHVIDIAQLGLGTDDTGPVEIEAKGGKNKHGVYDAFFDYEFTNTYANGVKMIGSTQSPRGLKFEGADGWIFIHIHGGKLEASDPAMLKEAPINIKVHLGRSPGHVRNFLDSVKSRKDPVATAEIGHRTASICHLNNIALLTGRNLKWDPKKEQFEGDYEANKLLTPVMRGPWKV
jgi:predicted dehydrogenase